ncbi:MAG: glycosyl hydrolase [Bacteroidetes bacterium]|nr:MAG: glycosyl hydrolase [Bacteroidota bacterium]
MKRLLLTLCITSIAVCFDTLAQSTTDGGNDVADISLSEQFDGLEWRCIGPYRGGRANAISGVVGDDRTYYAGYTGGGVWKTDNAGANWYNISDGYFAVGSIGDIAVSTSDPNVVFVGSGEHAVRGVMTSYGDGVYKSTDAGQSWVNVGLKNTRHISNVIIHPVDYNTVYVAAQGAVHGPNEDRGVYKSTDGGATWFKTLYIDENTGVSSLVMDKNNPRILYAATWQHRRYPWMVESGGPGSAIYKSSDGGETWNKVTHGLPDMMGKIGLSVSAANSNKVFAIVESEKSVSGLYRSDDGGINWKLYSTNPSITSRSWYYMEVFADPNNEDLVYVLNAPLMRSKDGGKTFESMRVVHGDCHGFWINPDDSDNIAMAEDGGATISFSKGNTWSTLNNQPTSQIYRVNADRRVPFWLYGGQQDNMSLVVPSRSKNYGILSSDWHNGPGCESAMVAFDDPYNPRVIYGGCFNGRLSLLDMQTKEGKDIMPYPMTNLGYEAKDMKYRFNWNAPLINSPHDPKIMYYGGDVLFKSENGGFKWEVISPDLTRNDTTKQKQGGGPFTNEGAGGENYNTIYYIAESTLEEGVIYTGSDCGMMHVTKDGGASWTDITPAGLPETMIHSIEVSPHDAGTVYFASTRYKFNDYANYCYKSTDYGASWTIIGTGIQEDDFFKVIREDIEVPGILYAGAERGFYISFDGGSSFDAFQLNLPVVPITDMIIRDNSLAISTAGRSFWILDDLSAIQQSMGKFNNESVQLYKPKEHYRIFGSPGFFLITEHAFGENPADGVELNYFLAENDTAELKLEIINSAGEVIRTVEGTHEEIENRVMGGRGNLRSPHTSKMSMNRGLNAFTWDFRTEPLLKVPDAYVFGADYRGHRVAPGKYSAKMTYGDMVSEVRIVIKDPPGLQLPPSVWEAQQALMQSIENRINEIHESINTLVTMQSQLESVDTQISSEDGLEDLKQARDALAKKIDNWQSVVIELRQKGFQDALNWPAGMNAEYFMLRNNLDTYDPVIPEGYRARFDDLEEQWVRHQQLYNDIMSDDVSAFNTLYRSKNLPVLPARKKIKP